MGNDIHIRPFHIEEWEEIKQIRLAALRDTPQFFAGTLEQALQKTEEDWKSHTNNPKNCVFGLFDGEAVIGCTGVFTSRENPEHCVFGFTYLKPEYRGQGLSKLMYEARIDWAKNQLHLKKALIGHRESNETSKRAMVRHGFQRVGVEDTVWPDGVSECEHKYELDLEALRRK